MGLTPLKQACGVCLAPGDALNHLDHLAVIAYLLDVPLVTDEESLFSITKKYYPQIKPIYIEDRTKILEFLASNYEVLFVSSTNYQRDLSLLFELIFRKKMQFWYCPHGHSDKPMKEFALQHMSLVYGDQMEDRLRKAGDFLHLKAYVKTGNYRFPFYLKYEAFYDQLVEEEVFSNFKKRQKTLLYAPTWHDSRASSSLFEVGEKIIKQLPDHYNLIIKLHPWIERQRPGVVHLLREKYGDKPNVVILSLYPLVLPLLKRVDIYLGDFSSIGYDFLYFDRPMFFFDSQERNDKQCPEASFLHNVGTFISEKEYEALYPFIEAHLDQESASSSQKRKELFSYAFGPSCDLRLLRERIERQVGALSKKSAL